MTDQLENAIEIVKEGMSRAPVAMILAAEAAIFAWLGWGLLGAAAEERAELRARNVELTEQLVHCHDVRAALSSHRDRKP